MNQKNKIILEGIHFGFGPAAHMIAICKKLRRKYRNKYEIIGMGEGSVFELISQSELFDSVLYFNQKLKLSNEILELIKTSIKIISIGDFDFVRKISELGYNVTLIDPLLWMWDEIPREIFLCEEYFAIAFPGVNRKISKLKNEIKNSSKIKVVNQICAVDNNNVSDNNNDYTFNVGVNHYHFPVKTATTL